MTHPPPRFWPECPLIGDLVRGTPFVSFKTPITPSYLAPTSPWLVQPEHTFTLSMLVKHQRARQRDLSLIVDLTDGKFYDGAKESRANECHYVNLYVKPPINGSDDYAVPADTVRAFIALVTRHLSQNPSAVIGVHDMYGYNLSLYVIARYLMEEGCSAAVAYQTVSQSRPPGLYNPSLVRSLYALDGEEVEFDFSIIQPPEWMTERVVNCTASGLLTVEEDEKSSVSSSSANIGDKQSAGKPAGTIRRKQKSTPAPQPSSSSSSPPPPSSKPNDPYADLLTSAGISVSSAIKPPSALASITAATATNNSAGTMQRKRKAETQERIPAQKQPQSSSPPQPPPTFCTNSDSHSNSRKESKDELVAILAEHSYLAPVTDRHEAHRLLSMLTTLVLSPSRLPLPLFPSLSESQLTEQLSTIWSWFDCFALDTGTMASMIGCKGECVLSWLPHSVQCLALIVRDGTFLSFRTATAAVTNIYRVPHLTFPQRSNPRAIITNTVCMGELLHDRVDGRVIPRLLVNDLLVSPTIVHPLPSSLSKRVNIVDTEIIMPRAQSQSTASIDEKAKCALHVRAKKFFPVNKINSVLSMPLPHASDGVVVMRNEGMIKVRNRGWVWHRERSNVSQDRLSNALVN